MMKTTPNDQEIGLVSENHGLNLLIGLPDDVMYNILLYTAVPNTITSILCHSIVPLCHATKTYVDSNDNLWEAILSGYYGNNNQSNNGGKTGNAFRARTQRRSSKRLRRTTAKEDVIHAHFVLRDQVRVSVVFQVLTWNMISSHLMENSINF